MTFFTNISNIGIIGNEQSDLKRTIILTNRLILLTLITALLYIPIVFFFELDKAYIASFITPTLVITLFLLSQRRWFQTASFLLIIIASLHILYMSSLDVNGYFHLFLITIFVFNLTLIQNLYLKVLLSVFIFSCFALSEYFQYHFRIDQTEMTHSEYIFFIINNILLLFTCIYTIFHFKVTNLQYEKEVLRQKLKIENQHNELNRIHFEIKSSIQYAKRIQTAILPPKKVIKKHLSNSFIVYEPKDIVAGDFYWTEVLDDQILFAVADCTGHGVPGAMISVVCHNALNRSVREFNLNDPAEILEKTREIIISEFEFSGKNMMDGMDIALVCMPIANGSGLEKKRHIRYAGANSPLYLVRNGLLKVHNPDKQPIGQYHSQSAFKTQTIPVEKNDMIFIFSDGFVSQFGGNQGKKLKYKPFKKLLTTISHLDTPLQSRAVIKSFHDWKGEYEQVDDICMIGVKI